MASTNGLCKQRATLSLAITSGQKQSILAQMLAASPTVPSLHLDTNKFRRGPDPEARSLFRERLLSSLTATWHDSGTNQRFLQLFEALQSQGCAVFAEMIRAECFEKLIHAYTVAQHTMGNNTFLHSYINFADHLQFVMDNTYNDAFLHPLLIALIAYSMGGPVRITDLRGKDTDPISINAQDNMLHVDNTPFCDEYKILLAWERGVPNGPSGQNFTFIPGTHKGNRDILLNTAGEPWSTERDSLFISDAAIDGLFDFQKTAIGSMPIVIETQYTDAPISLVFPASSLAHHRYRTEGGNGRSCVIVAFHLCDQDPGSFAKEDSQDDKRSSIAELMVNYQSGDVSDAFLSLLTAEAGRIENTISQLWDRHGSNKIVELGPMRLSDEELKQWRNSVVYAPSAAEIKLTRNIYLSSAVKDDHADVLDKLISVMMYDKHGLLQLILYEDGREEIRKLSRKRIGEMKRDEISTRLKPWLSVVQDRSFSNDDLPSPTVLHSLANELGDLINSTTDLLSGGDKSGYHAKYLASMCRLIFDLGEAITRCEKMETYISTSLFLFWTTDEILKELSKEDDVAETRMKGAIFLRNYVAAVLIFEESFVALADK